MKTKPTIHPVGVSRGNRAGLSGTTPKFPSRRCYKPGPMRGSIVVVVGGLLLTACFSKPADVDWDAPPGGAIDGAVDSPSIDAMSPDAMVTPANLTTTALPHNFGDVTVGQQSS